MDINSTYIVLLFVFGTIAVFGNLIIIAIYVRTHTLRELTSKLILLVHISCTGQMIAAFPKIYQGNWFICGFMGWFHYYCGLLNIGVITLLTLCYYNLINENSTLLRKNLSKYGLKIAFLFPIITFFPFSTGSYRATNDWCTLEGNSQGDLWAIFTYYIWISMQVLFCLILFIYIIYRASKYSIGIRKKLFSSIGAYILITLICLVPQTLPRYFALTGKQSDDDNPSKNDAEFAIQFPLLLAGLAYIICYIVNREIILLYDNRTDPHESSDLEISMGDFDMILKGVQKSRAVSSQPSSADSSSRSVFEDIKDKELPSEF